MRVGGRGCRPPACAHEDRSTEVARLLSSGARGRERQGCEDEEIRGRSWSSEEACGQAPHHDDIGKVDNAGEYRCLPALFVREKDASGALSHAPVAVGLPDGYFQGSSHVGAEVPRWVHKTPSQVNRLLSSLYSTCRIPKERTT